MNPPALRRDMRPRTLSIDEPDGPAEPGYRPDEEEILDRCILIMFRRCVASRGGLTASGRSFWRVGMFPEYHDVRVKMGRLDP